MAGQKESYSHFLEEVLANLRNSSLKGAAETDVRYSFDVEGSITKGRRLIALCKEAGIERERVLIKIAVVRRSFSK